MTINQALRDNIITDACYVINNINRIKRKKDLEFLEGKTSCLTIELANILDKESEKNEQRSKKY